MLSISIKAKRKGSSKSYQKKNQNSCKRYKIKLQNTLKEEEGPEPQIAGYFGKKTALKRFKINQKDGRSSPKPAREAPLGQLK